MGSRSIQRELSWPVRARLLCVLSTYKPLRKDSADNYEPQNSKHKEWQESSGVVGKNGTVQKKRRKSNYQPERNQPDPFHRIVPVAMSAICLCEILLREFVIDLHGLRILPETGFLDNKNPRRT